MSPDMQQPPPPRPAPIPRLLIGAFLVLMGLLLALDQIGWVDANHLTRFWPALVVLYGLSILQRGGHGVVMGSILIVIGGCLLLTTLLWSSCAPLRVFWSRFCV